MTGTLINVATILIGGTLGLIFGARVPERLKSTVISGMGLFTAAIGMQMFLKTENSLIVLGALLIGALLGEWWKIEDRLQSLGQILEARFAKSDPANANGEVASNKFVHGFLTASLLFCVGPMAILGSIQDGLTGNYNLLAVKSVLDGFASLAFASTLGVGVMFSSLMILVYDGTKDPEFVKQAGSASKDAVLSCPCGPATGAFADEYTKKFGRAGTAPAPRAMTSEPSSPRASTPGAVTREELLKFAKTYQGQGVARKYQWTDNGELTTTLIWIYKVQ